VGVDGGPAHIRHSAQENPKMTRAGGLFFGGVLCFGVVLKGLGLVLQDATPVRENSPIEEKCNWSNKRGGVTGKKKGGGS